MNVKITSIVKNLGYSFSVNALTMIISVLSVLFFPKILGLKEYGIWQLYLFYFSFCGFLPLGWLDGIYLRYGGRNFEKLNNNLISLGFIFFICFIIFEMTILGILGNILFISDEKLSVLKFLINSLIFYIPFAYLRNLLQLANHIKDFAKVTFIERFTFFIGIIFVIFYIDIITDQFMIVDIVAKAVAFSIALYYCRSIITKIKLKYWKRVLKDIRSNIYVGYNLMFANIASMLVFGIIRFGISEQWDIITFGKISLTFSICNFLIVFINGASIVLFPILKNISEDFIKKTYSILNIILTPTLLFCLFFYYPLKEILSIWLPKYMDAFIYMAILFPVCIFESKMALLVSTYLKALRKEKTLLHVNIIGLCISFILTFICAYVLHILDLTVFSIIVVIALRNIIAEIVLNRTLGLNLLKETFLELIVVFSFVFSNYFFTGYISFFIYLGIYILYLICIKNQLNASYRFIINYIKR